MSSTSNVQDLLVNVFRPTYQYQAGTGFVPSLVLSNISEVITGRLQTGAFTVTDSNRNTFIGSNAGANASSNGCVENVALGYSAMAGAVSSSNNTAFGYSNFYGLTRANSNVGIGPNVTMGQGNKNILIGPNVVMGDGSGNILLGSDISVGNVSKRLQLGTLLYGDLSSGFFGVNTSQPKVAFDISGTTVFRGKVGFQVEAPKYSLDVAGSIYSTERFFGGLGTLKEPVYSFEDASSSGMYVPVGYGTGAFAIATNGSPTAVFASNSVYFYRNLDVSGTFSARNVVLDAFSVQNGTAAIPTITFANDQSSGLFLVSPSNLGFTTNGTRRMALLGNGDLSMGRALVSDISASGVILSSAGCNIIGGVTLCNGYVFTSGTSTSNVIAPGYIRHDDPATLLDISGGNISNSLTTLSSNFRASNGTVARPAVSFVADPSTGVHLINGSAMGFDTAGVLRMCVSGAFVGIGTPTPRVALDVSGDISANVYNGPGGTEGAPHYTFSDDRTTGLFFPGANMVGLTAGGAERMRISNSNIGIGTKAPANALDVSGTLRVIGLAGDITFTNGTVSIGGTQVLSSTGVISNTSTTSNTIGGVTLTNSDLCMGSTGRILAPIVRNALVPTLYDISGGNVWYTGALSNATTSASNLIGGVTLSNQDISLSATGRVLGVSTTSNQLGGVTLSNQDISLSATGRILGVATNSNRIGGVTLSNFDLSMASTGRILAPILRDAVTPASYDISGGNISNSGTLTSTNAILSGYIRNALTPITYDISGGNISNSGTTRSSNFIGTVTTASNSIGGVTLSNTNLTLAGTITGSTTTASNSIGGVTLSNTNLTLAGTITGSTANTNNSIGGVTLSNTNLTLAGTITGSTANTNNSIGGVTLSNTNITAGGTLTSLNALHSGYIRDGLTPSLYDISGGNISNSGFVRSSNLQVSGLAVTPGTPNFTFGIDPSSGMHRSSAGGNSVAFSTAGLQRMVISNANVGIGTTAPLGSLDVFTGGIVVNRLGNVTNATDVSMIVEGNQNVGLYLQKGANNNFCGVSFKTLSNNVLAERFRIDGDTGRVGIGITAPTYPLDISVSSAVPLGLRSYGLTGGGNNMIELLGSSPTGIPVRRIGLGLSASTGTGNDGNDFSINTYTDAGAFLNTPVIVKRATGRVGIGTTLPSYALDVVAEATTNASVNMSTWPRGPVSNFFWVRGCCNANYSVYRIRWNTTNRNIPNTAILDWGDDATHGSYFRILKSGIWTISYGIAGNGASGYTWMDVSTSISNGYASPSTSGAGDLIAIGPYAGSTSFGMLTFTGYLPANTGRYYRFYNTNTVSGAVANTQPYLNITLIYETPDIAPTNFFSS